jgi:hypothetical protein
VAEIRIEPKRRSLAWLWILLVVALIALAAWYFMSQGAVRVDTTGALPAGAIPGVAIPLPVALA